MAFVIDTNIAIALRDGDALTATRIGGLAGAILMSVITRVELEGGVWREPAFAKMRRARLDAILAAIPVLAFDDDAASLYARIVETSGYARRKLLDRMIAAQAMQHRATLITRNADDFRDIKGLKFLAW